MGTAAPLIRLMVPGDLAVVKGLEEENFVDAWTEGMLQLELKNPVARVYVLEQQGEVIGYADFWLVAGEAQLNRIAIGRGRHNQGLGKYFLGNLIGKFWSGGAEWMTLEVRNNNLTAQKLYTGLGFCQEGCRKDYFGKGIDAIIMWLYRHVASGDRVEPTGFSV